MIIPCTVFILDAVRNKHPAVTVVTIKGWMRDKLMNTLKKLKSKAAAGNGQKVVNLEESSTEKVANSKES